MMLGAIISILEQVLILINRYLEAKHSEAAKIEAGDAVIDQEVQDAKNKVAALGDSVSDTLAALQRLRDAQSGK